MRTLHLMLNQRGINVELRAWEDPIPGAEYLLGGDVALGEKEKRSVGDRCSVEVFRRRFPYGLTQVAEGAYRWDTAYFGDIINAVGRRYNTAWLNIERNLSHAAQVTLKRLGYPLARWFVPVIQGSTRGNEAPIYFFQKTNITQKYLYDVFLDYLRQQGMLELRSQWLIDEIYALQKDDRGVISTGGKDLSVAAMMAVVMDAALPSVQPPPKEELPMKQAPFGEDVNLWMKRQQAGKQTRQRDPEAPVSFADEDGGGGADELPDFSEPVSFGFGD